MDDRRYHYGAELVRVVDGDTLRVAVDVGFGLINRGPDGKGLVLRLLGVDTPELRGDEREQGKAAMIFVSGWLYGRVLRVHTKSVDSFGRWLADVYDGETGESLGDAIRAAGHDTTS